MTTVPEAIGKLRRAWLRPEVYDKLLTLLTRSLAENEAWRMGGGYHCDVKAAIAKHLVATDVAKSTFIAIVGSKT